MNTEIVQIISDSLGVPPESVAPDTSMETTPAWDSMMHMNICLSVEQAFGVQLTPEEIIAMTSVAAIEETLKKKGRL
jgi:acyl carrier protein